MKHRLSLIKKISQNCTKLQKKGKKTGRRTMLNSTRVQIKSRNESSGAALNLHKSYLFLKYDLGENEIGKLEKGSGAHEDS